MIPPLSFAAPLSLVAPPSFIPRRRPSAAFGAIPLASLASHSTNILTSVTAGERTLGRQCRAKNLQTSAIITKSYAMIAFCRAITTKRQVNFQKSR
jgi:hypothetical protein